MSLEEYKKKRKFNRTSEPLGGSPVDNKLQFVVQKHAASHLHYDFRLELKGILKSWAVPKAPSLDPEEKRLAMMTEDHPYDYKNFEGIIPKGQYGGGTVIIWDEGTYSTPDLDENDKKAQEHALTGQLYKGGMLINLNGKKLKGQFAIIKAPDKDEKSWYLLKVKDKHASKADVTKKDKSVVSGLTIEQMAANAEARQWQSNRTSKAAEDPGPAIGLDRQLLEKGIKCEMPKVVNPMNATLIKEIFDDANWVYEVKLDGYRIAALIKDGKVTLQTRAAQNYTKYYSPVVNELQQFPFNAILDGELVALEENGRPNFDLLQSYNGTVPLVYYVFDVLWLDGYDVTCLNLLERKSLLSQVLPQNETIKYSEHFEDGTALWEQIQAMELEGIVAKRKDSIYQQNKRTKDWLKLPTEIRQEFVIGGWTESGSGRPFRSILFGAYEDGQLKFVGHSGSGFKDEVMKQIMERLEPLEIKEKPFVDEVDHDTTPHWVKPELVANFKFSTWTAGGKIRKPAIFLGFREDKNARDVVREVPLSAKEEERVVNEKTEVEEHEIITEPALAKVRKAKAEKLSTSEDSNWPEIENQKITSSEVFDIEGCQIILANIEKELWEGITKAHLIQYYHSISSYILPYLKDRPQSLHIKHIKPTAPGLYIKDMEGRQPDCASIFTIKRKHKKRGKRDVIDYLVCNNEATLLYIVNLGCIDINPWTSKTANYLYPDFIIIDLDPSDDDFKKVTETARAAKQLFDKHKLKAFPKTSGKTGLHLYLPCNGFTFAQARDIAEGLCKEVNALVPEITTTEVTISKRGNRLYIDPNQNDEADTVAAPYSVRPFHHPSVSTPLEWKEINDKLNPLNFDMHNILQRIEKKGDLFAGVMDEKIAAKNSIVLRTFL